MEVRSIAPGIEVLESPGLSRARGIGFVSHAYGMSDDSRYRAKILKDYGYDSIIFKRDDRVITEEPNALEEAIEAIQIEIAKVLEKVKGGENVILAASLGGVMIGAAAARIESSTGVSPVELIVHDSPLLNGRERCHDYFIAAKPEWCFHDSNVDYLHEIRGDYERIVATTPTRFLLEQDDPHNQLPILESLASRHPDSVEISRIDLPGKRHGFLLPKVRLAITDQIGNQQK